MHHRFFLSIIIAVLSSLTITSSTSGASAPLSLSAPAPPSTPIHTTLTSLALDYDRTSIPSAVTVVALLAFPHTPSAPLFIHRKSAGPTKICLTVAGTRDVPCFTLDPSTSSRFLPSVGFKFNFADVLLAEGVHEIVCKIFYDESILYQDRHQFFRFSIYTHPTLSALYTTEKENAIRLSSSSLSTSQKCTTSISDKSESCSHLNSTLLSTRDPQLFITSMPIGQIILSSKPLLITYTVLNVPAIGTNPNLSPRITMTFQNSATPKTYTIRAAEDAIVTNEHNTVTLSQIEPGSHAMTSKISWFDSESGERKSSVFAGRTVFEAVLTESAGGSKGYGRLRLGEAGELESKVLENESRSGYQEICIGACTSDKYNGIEHEYDNESKDDDSNTTTSTTSRRGMAKKKEGKIKILFVGVAKLDGQKTIWFQQMKHLNSSRFILQFSTFVDPSRSKDYSKFKDILDELNVPLSISPLPAVAQEVLAETPDFDYKNLFSDSGEVNMDTLVKCLQLRLEKADFVISDVTPSWVRESWETMTTELTTFAPDILVFANARETTDSLLLTAARLAKVHQIVMELPNLLPVIDTSLLSCLVGPSHYAVLHHSVQSALLTNREVGAMRKSPSLHVINPGVDTTVFNDSGATKCTHLYSNIENHYLSSAKCGGAIVVGFVGRVSGEKSPGLFIQVVKQVLEQDRSVRFVVVGDGPFLDVIKELVLIYGVLHSVEFVGAKYGQELVEIMRGFDILLGASLRHDSETFCITNLEAMALGIPVVAFGIGGVGEYLRNEVNGVVVDEFDDANPSSIISAVALRITELLADDGKRRRLGEGGKEMVLKGGYLVEDFVRKYSELYEELARM